ncbi:hypothetical protein RIEGSTA812A_PEG_1077 [invertebrate metagenome]|uniref:Uncharacterized protein n=1 Tax=invertebrate metagenome TaxID=1711999 RepID=A0A484H7B2_9ZZZZ
MPWLDLLLLRSARMPIRTGMPFVKFLVGSTDSPVVEDIIPV